MSPKKTEQTYRRISPYPNQPSGQGSQPESSTSAHQSQWQPATQTGPTINPTPLPEAPTYQQFPLVDPTNQQYAQQYASTVSPDEWWPKGRQSVIDLREF